jgi:hypothetical protein
MYLGEAAELAPALLRLRRSSLMFSSRTEVQRRCEDPPPWGSTGRRYESWLPDFVGSKYRGLG